MKMPFSNGDIRRAYSRRPLQRPHEENVTVDPAPKINAHIREVHFD